MENLPNFRVSTSLYLSLDTRNSSMVECQLWGGGGGNTTGGYEIARADRAIS